VRKLALPLALLLLLAACSSPTDAPAQSWVEFLGRHGQAVEAGKFDPKTFQREGTPIVDALLHHRDAKTGKLLMSEEPLTRFRAANTAFDNACRKAGNTSALAAYDALIKPLLAAQPEE
jgi:hypothetical protein